MAAIGEVDEANTAIGMAIAALDPAKSPLALTAQIQNEMFDLGADIATPGGGDASTANMPCASSRARSTRLEEEIDAMNAVARAADQLHPAGRIGRGRRAPSRPRRRPPRRARGRRAGRRANAVNPHALAYLNRLSDHLFVAARSVAAGEGGDVLWQPGATRDELDASLRDAPRCDAQR